MTTSKTRDAKIPTFKSLGDGPLPSGTSSTGMYLLPAGHTWNGRWRLTGDLLVEIRITSEAVLLLSHGALEEYGAGDTLDEGVWDFLTTLSDYRESLQERDGRLPEDEQQKLSLLLKLVEPVPIA